jgi:hypothetical protein
MDFMQKRIPQLRIIGATLLVAVTTMTNGCSRPKEKQDVRSDLKALENVFGISFPTNIVSQEAGSWDFRAPLDGNSKNTETLAKLEVPEGSFHSWRQSVTNRMQEYPQFGVSPKPRLTNAFPWWDPHRWPRSEVTYYHAEIDRQPKKLDQLDIYTTPRGSNVLVYIYGFRSDR